MPLPLRGERERWASARLVAAYAANVVLPDDFDVMRRLVVLRISLFGFGYAARVGDDAGLAANVARFLGAIEDLER